MSLDEIRNERIKKLEKLQEKSLNPYPAQSRRTYLVSEALKKFGTLSKFGKKLILAGRIVAKREHGGSTFFDVRDSTGKIQVYFKKDILDRSYETGSHKITRPGLINVNSGSRYDFALETLDVGDFIETEGKLFKTKKGEETLEVFKWKVLAKSLRPLPEKWHGLQDVEERFRKRYLDLLMNEEVRGRFEARLNIMKHLREFMQENNFLEVETPMFHPIPGGALAKPFQTHHNALDTNFYLRVAPELYLKRLLVGGLEKVYEIGKCFRNEGIDATHNPEFTMLECYASFWDEEKMMAFVENLFLVLAKSFGKKGELEFDDKKILFKKPFARITFADLLSRYAQLNNFYSQSREAVSMRAKQLGIDVAPHETKGKIADEIYKKICRPHLLQPTFVINHPWDISPLAKKRDENSQEVRRFQLIAGGYELANGFAELNDPLEQRKRFEEQEKMRGEGELEAHVTDEDYLEAMEYGMPPAAGLGIGIDRLVMLFTNTKNVREVVLFPTLRPK